MPEPVGRRLVELDHPLDANRWDDLDAPAPGTWQPHRTVSVVIPHYNAQDDLTRVLTGLTQQTYPHHLIQVVVSDDGSDAPPTVDVGSCLRTTVITQAHRGFGAARARNHGARAADGELLVFLDGDTVPQPTFLESIARWLHLVPEAFVIGHRRYALLDGMAADDLITALHATDPQAALGDRCLADPSWSRRYHSMTRHLAREDPELWRTTISSVLGCRADFFDQVGGFDESFTSWGGEDVELGYRAFVAGAVMIHDVDAVAWHNGPPSGVDDAKRVARQRSVVKLAELVPAERYRSPGTVHRVPRVLIQLDAWGASDLAVLACATSWLSGSFRDAALAIDVEPHRRADLAASFASDPRVEVGDPPADVVQRTPLRVRLSRPLLAEPDTLRRVVDWTTPPRGAGVLTIGGAGRDLVLVLRTRALARAARWTTDPAGQVELAGHLFGRTRRGGPAAGVRVLPTDESVDLLGVQRRFRDWDRANVDFEWLFVESLVRRATGARGVRAANEARRLLREGRSLVGAARHSSAAQIGERALREVRAAPGINGVVTRVEAGKAAAEERRVAARPMREVIEVVRRRTPDDRPSAEQPVFVLAAGWRSGSTLVQRLLMSTDEFFLWGEPFDRAVPVRDLVWQVRSLTDAWPPPAWFYEDRDGEGRDLASEWIANLSPDVAALVDAQRTYLATLLGPPVDRGGTRWGFKEVRVSGEDARWLAHLYPRAKFVFLVRNPADAYGSYKAMNRWFERWPDRIVTGPAAFGAMWDRLASSFVDAVEEVDGALLRYEDLLNGRALDTLDEFLGTKVDRGILRVTQRGARSWRRYDANRWDRRVLRTHVGDTARALGYAV